MRGADQTITVWVQNESVWERHVIDGCSWEQMTVNRLAETGRVSSNEYAAMIPKGTDDAQYEDLLKPGILVAKGEVDTDVSDTKTVAQLRKELAPNVFIAKSVSNRTQNYRQGKHYLVNGV